MPELTAKPARRAVRFGVFELDVQGAELRRKGVRVHLQPKPFQMLAVLVTHHRWPLFDFTGAGTPSTPQDGGLICWIRSRSDRVLPEWWALE